MQHFEYCANLVGIDHVAFGPDDDVREVLGEIIMRALKEIWWR